LQGRILGLFTRNFFWNTQSIPAIASVENSPKSTSSRSKILKSADFGLAEAQNAVNPLWIDEYFNKG
jgi:hypothetical protein